MAKIFGFNSLTGGGVGSLDSIDGSVLTVGDLALGADSSQEYSFILDGSGDAESSPDTIAPNTNAGVKRWKRRHDTSRLDGTGLVTGDVVQTNASTNLVSGNIVQASGNKKVIDSGRTMSSITNRNILHNPFFDIGQRGTSFTSATAYPNSDDLYTLDRWILLSDGNDIVDVSRQYDPATESTFPFVRLDVETANKKFGIIQLIENKDIYPFVSGAKTVCFSFYARVTSVAKLDNIKAGILAWTSTADAVTSDVVSAWGNENVNPTLVANWTFKNTPANLNVTTDWARYYVTATIDDMATRNLAVMIWSDVTDTTAGDFLNITACQFEAAPIYSDPESRSFSEELLMCRRFFESSSDLGSAPGTGGGGNVGQRTATGTNLTATFTSPKRSTPALIWFSPVTGASGKVRNYTTSADDNASDGSIGFNRASVVDAAASTGDLLAVHWTAQSDL
jgi:hypothetical protein